MLYTYLDYEPNVVGNGKSLAHNQIFVKIFYICQKNQIFYAHDEFIIYLTVLAIIFEIFQFK